MTKFFTILAILTINTSCINRSDDFALTSNNLYDYNLILNTTIDADNLHGMVFSDDGNEFLWWSDKKAYLYSFVNNNLKLCKTINFGVQHKWGYNIYFPLFEILDEIPQSFTNLRKYIKSSVSKKSNNDSPPIVYYKGKYEFIQSEDNPEASYIRTPSGNKIYLSAPEATVVYSAMSSLDMSSSITSASVMNESKIPPNTTLKEISLARTLEFTIWSNDGTYFIITDKDIINDQHHRYTGTSNCEVYISPTAKYGIIMIATPKYYPPNIRSYTGLVRSIVTIPYQIYKLMENQRYTILVFDAKTGKILTRKSSTTSSSLFLYYSDSIAMSEKKMVIAMQNEDKIEFHQLKLK